MKKRKLSLRSIGRELRVAIEASRGKKATELLVMDLRGLASFTDFFLICSGSSSRQMQAIAEAIRDELGKIRVQPNHIEGYLQGEWILMDYVDFVIHIFSPRSRSYYELERLWGDAERLAIAS